MKYWLEDIHGDLVNLDRMLRQNGLEKIRGNKLSTVNPDLTPDILLLSHTGTDYHRNIIDKFPDARVFSLSHGAPFTITYDGIWEPHPRTEAYIGQTYADAWVAGHGNDLECRYVGWYMNFYRPFKPCDYPPQRILFAPIHPLPSNGWLHHIHRLANAEALHNLSKFAGRWKSTPSITVRYSGTPAQNGLHNDKSIEWEPKTGRVNWDDIRDRFDMVVSYNRTFLAQAVAAGMPAVAFAQHYPWFESWGKGDYREAKNWEEYADTIRFPYDLRDCNRIIPTDACDVEPTDWKLQFTIPFCKWTRVREALGVR